MLECIREVALHDDCLVSRALAERELVDLTIAISLMNTLDL